MPNSDRHPHRGPGMDYSLSPRNIGFRLEGGSEDAGRVRFRDLVEFLERFAACLRRVDEAVTGSDKATVYYRVVDMQASSAEVILEALPMRSEYDAVPAILSRIDSALVSILEVGEMPEAFDRELLETFKGLSAPLRRHVRGIEIVRPARRFSITSQFEATIERILGEDLTAVGSVAGFLDAVNVHGVRHFHIYPMVGPTKILCVFSDELLPEVRKGLKRHVNVIGLLRYKKNEVFPHQIDVESLEVFPPAEELPTLRSLRGMAPEATGSLDSVTFVRQLRDASET